MDKARVFTIDDPEIVDASPPKRVAELSVIARERFPSMRRGDVILLMKDRLVRRGLFFDGQRVIPDVNGYVPPTLSVPMDFPPTFWVIGNAAAKPSNYTPEDLVTIIYGRRYHLYLPSGRPYTNEDLYLIRTIFGENAVAMPINVNGHVYYIAARRAIDHEEDEEDDGVEIDEGTIVQFLYLVNTARERPVAAEIVSSAIPRSMIPAEDIIMVNL